MTIFAETVTQACEAWSLVPIICLIIGVASIVGVYFLVSFLKKKKLDKYLNLLILIYGFIFLGLELYHQITRYYQLGHYDWSSIPFQFCSIPIYLCLILPFIKGNKYRDPFFYYLAIYGMVGGLFPLLFGQSALCRWPDIWGVVRSFVWHFMILHVSMIAIAYRPIASDLKTTWKPMVGCIGIFISLTVIAQMINVTLHYTGGIDFPVDPAFGYKTRESALLNPLDPDTAGCFYISPYIQPAMPVYNNIWKDAGWIVNYITYVSTFSLLAGIIYFAIFGVKQLITYLKNKKQASIQE